MTAEELVIQLKAQIQQFESQMKKASSIAKDAGQKMGKAIEETEKKSKGLVKSLFSLKGALAAVGATAAIMMAKRWVEASNRQEQAVQRIRALIKAQGEDYERLTPIIEKATAALQKKTTYADEVQIEAMARMKAVGVDTLKMLKAWPLVLDVAAGTGMDLATAAMYVGRAMEGQPEMLARYVPAIRNLSKEQRDWTHVQEILIRQFRGVAEEMARTPAGKVQQLANAWGDFQEKLGDIIKIAIVPFLERFLKGITYLMDNWKILGRVMFEITKETFIQLGKIVMKFFTDREAFEAGIKLLGEFFKSWLKICGESLKTAGLVVARASSVIWAPFIKSLEWLADNFRYYFQLGIEKAKKAIATGLNVLSQIFIKLVNFVTQKVINPIIVGFETFANSIVGSISGAVGSVVNVLSRVPNFILKAFGTSKEELKKFAEDVKNKWKVELDKIPKIAEDALTIKIPESTLREPAKFTAKMSEAWETIKAMYGEIPKDIQKYIEDLKEEWDNVMASAKNFGEKIDWEGYCDKIAALVEGFKEGTISAEDLKEELGNLTGELENVKAKSEDVRDGLKETGEEGSEAIGRVVNKLSDMKALLEEINTEFRRAVWGEKLSQQVSLLEDVHSKYNEIKSFVSETGKGQEEINKLIIGSIPKLHKAGMEAKAIVTFWESLGENIPLNLELANKELQEQIFLYKSGAKYVTNLDKHLASMPQRVKETVRATIPLGEGLKEPVDTFAQKLSEMPPKVSKVFGDITDILKHKKEELVLTPAPLTLLEPEIKVEKDKILTPYERLMEERDRRLKQSFLEYAELHAAPRTLDMIRTPAELEVDLFENAKKTILDTTGAINREIPKVSAGLENQISIAVDEVKKNLTGLAEYQQEVSNMSVDYALRYYEHLVAMDRLTTQERISLLETILEKSKYAFLAQWEIEEQLHELRKKLAQEEMEQYLKKVEMLKNIQKGMTDTMASAIMAGKGITEAFRSAGEHILNEFVKKALETAINKLWEIIGLQRMLGGIFGGLFGWLFGFEKGAYLPKGSLVPIVPAQEGFYTKKPTLAAVAEAGVPEIVAPEPKLREIVREEGGKGINIENINISISFPNANLEDMDQGRIERIFRAKFIPAMRDAIKTGLLAPELIGLARAR